MRISVIGLRGFPFVEGGVEKHCELLYTKMLEETNITVYRRKPYVKNATQYDNINFVDLPSTKIKGFEALIHSFLATVHACIQKPDLVHYHNIGPALFSPIVKLRKIPVVLTYHSANYEHKKWGWFAKKILKLSEKIAFKVADKIIFVNKFQMSKFNQKTKLKSVYIPNGIEKQPLSKSMDYLKENNLEKNKYILSVGRITPEKGFDTLIKAYYIAKLQDIKLVIAGGVEFENEYMKKLKALCNDKNVVFTGYTFGDDLSQLYSNAALYVLASRNEGFPLVLLEAMMYKLDVIVSDIPGTHLVDLDCDDYFSVDKEYELAEKLRERISNIRKREYDLSAFDWNKIAYSTVNIYKEVLGGLHD